MLSIGTSFGDSVLNGNNAKITIPFMEEITLYNKGDIIMKKVIAAMIGIAFAFCCFMLLDGCNSSEVVESEETYYQASYAEVIEANVKDSLWNDDYSYFAITETPNENKDGMLRYITYDAEGNALTMNSVDYDWAVSYYFN